MKKTYILPKVLIVNLRPSALIANSLDMHADGMSGEMLIKENVTNSSSPHYNVWDDDWSK